MIVNQEVATLAEVDYARLFLWGSNIWGSHGLRYKLTVEKPWRRFVRYEQQVAVSHVGLVTAVATIGREAVTIAGLGGIVTNPAFQCRGHATALIADVLRRCRRQAFHDVAMIFCLDHRFAFYQAGGWTPISAPVTVDQPDGQRVVQSPYRVLWRPLKRALESYPQDARIQIEGRPW